MVILIIAMIIFGPRRLPEIAAKAGKIVRDLRNMSQGLLLEWQREITVASRLDDLEETRRELAELKKELGQTQREIGQQARKSAEQFQKQIAAGASEVENTLKIEDEPATPETLPTDSETKLDSDQSGDDGTPEMTPEEKPPQESKSDLEQLQEQEAITDTLPVEESTNLAPPPEPESIPDPKESETVTANGRPGSPDKVSGSVEASSDISSPEQSSKPKEVLNE